MSDNLPPGVSDYDLPGYNEFYTTRDTECPECGFVEKDVDVLGDFDPRWGNRKADMSATCGRCGHEWEWVEDLDDR